MNAKRFERSNRTKEDLAFAREKLDIETRAHILADKIAERLKILRGILYDEQLRQKLPFPNLDEVSPWNEYFRLGFIEGDLGWNFEQGHFDEKRNEFLAKGQSLQTEEKAQSEYGGLDYDGIPNTQRLLRQIDEATSPEEIANLSQKLTELEKRFEEAADLAK